MMRVNKQIVLKEWQFDENKPPGILVKFYRKLNHGGCVYSSTDFVWEAMSYFDQIEFSPCKNLSEIFLITEGDEYIQDYEVQYLSLAKMLSFENKDNHYQERYIRILDPKSDLPGLMVITGMKINLPYQNMKSMLNKIHKIIEEQNINGVKLRSEMFLTLGFSDIAIVFRTNSYLSVLQTLYQIGKLPPNDKEENFFYSVPAYASNIDWDSIIDHDSLRIYSLISSKNVNKTAKQLSIRNLQSNMHFGQYDFGVDPCQDRERNFTEIKKMLDLPANEHVKYQLSYKFSKYLKEINNE